MCSWAISCDECGDYHKTRVKLGQHIIEHFDLKLKLKTEDFVFKYFILYFFYLSFSVGWANTSVLWSQSFVCMMLIGPSLFSVHVFACVVVSLILSKVTSTLRCLFFWWLKIKMKHTSEFSVAFCFCLVAQLGMSLAMSQACAFHHVTCQFPWTSGIQSSYSDLMWMAKPGAGVDAIYSFTQCSCHTHVSSHEMNRHRHRLHLNNRPDITTLVDWA